MPSELKQCVHCGKEFKPQTKNNKPNAQKYCTRACWVKWYEKSGRKQTPNYKAVHKAATYRCRAKAKQRKLEARERNRERISHAFKRGLRYDRYGFF